MARMGAARARALGRKVNSQSAAAADSAGAIPMVRKEVARLVRRLTFTSLERLHSNSRLWLTNTRKVVRTMASRLK